MTQLAVIRAATRILTVTLKMTNQLEHTAKEDLIIIFLLKKGRKVGDEKVPFL